MPMQPRPIALTSRPCPRVRFCIRFGPLDVVVIRSGLPCAEESQSSRFAPRGGAGEEDSMAKSGEVLEIPDMGFKVTFLRTGSETGGEVSEFEVSGRFRGFLTQE